jgi:cysteine-S-conjugate beta-lyase
MNLDTRLIHTGDDANQTQSVTPPIWQTSTYKAPDSPKDFADLAGSINPAEFYSRHGSATNKQVEQIIAALEKTESALLAASGMGAISAAILSQVNAGDHIVTQSTLYAAAMTLFRDMLPKWNITVTFVDQTDTAAFERAIKPNTKLIYLETPSNPLMKLTDLKSVAAMAKSKNILTLCDNTFASPLNQQPHTLGIDIVLHSATKYLGGHSDLTAGVVCGSKSHIDKAWKTMIVLGSSLAAFDAWLLLRGLRTLSLRVQKINTTALRVAEFLSAHPAIHTVHFPFLKSHPQHTLALAQMTGSSGMMSFDVHGETEEQKFEIAQRVIQKLTLATNAVSLGGIETLIVHPASMWSYHYTPEQRKAMGISAGLIRLSIGLEDAEDLIADFQRALGNRF